MLGAIAKVLSEIDCEIEELENKKKKYKQTNKSSSNATSINRESEVV